MDIYKKINPINRVGGEALDELKISVRYDKGDYYDKRGVYVYIRPVHREGRGNGFVSETCTLLGDTHESGFRMLLRELGRKSQKVEDEIAAKIDAKADEIATLWDEQKHTEVANILRTAM
jgi:hypothetical protein